MRLSSHDLAARSFWLSAVLFVCGATGVFAAALEWGHYLSQVAAVGVAPTWRDRAVILWLLWWKSLVVCMPWVALGGLLACRRCHRAAKAVVVLPCLAVLFWLTADLRLQQFSGNHAADFLPYLYDAARMPVAANHAQWGGDTSTIALAVVTALAAVVVIGGSFWFACGAAVGWAARRWPRLASPACWASIAVVAALVVGLVPGQGLATRPLLLRAVKVHLPVGVATLDQLSAWTLAHLGVSLPARQVCIVSLLANPAGPDGGREEVHLHNFSGEAVALDGWRLENSRGQRLALEGDIASGGTRVVVIPDRDMPLRNDGDQVRLLDAAEQDVHQVSYGPHQAKYGRLLHFRSAADYDEFELRLNSLTEAAYRQLLPRLVEPKPVDATATFQRADAPNVVLLVLESLRHDAIGPEMMSKLEAWGRQGLRLRRHYAGSNASHLGLYALLYGRSPITYDATLDARIPPQLPASLRGSGYETIFLTAGDCNGFRRMSEYLNAEAFDHLIVDDGEVWQDRPLRDSRVLAQVRRLATERSRRPRFIMAFLMSTHFPYTFPADFDLHQPSGEHIDYLNWKQADREVLRNRYRNAAAFLESEILRTLQALDSRRNVVIVTGDHGESLGEDGGLAHGTRGSEMQLRVPFVMVGPGIAASSIEAPTTHVDLLPTLLHALAGRKLQIAHAQGRDLLDAVAADDAGTTLGSTVLLAPYRWQEPLDLVLVRGDERMQFNYHLSAPQIKTFGFCDEACNLDLSGSHDCSEESAAEWAEALREELDRVAR